MAKKICTNISYYDFECYTTAWYVNNSISEASRIIYTIFDKGYSVMDILDSYFQFIKICNKRSHFICKIDSQKNLPKYSDLEKARLFDIEQIKSIKNLRKERNEQAINTKLKNITEACRTNSNLVPLIIDAAQSQATLGELVTSMKVVFGEWQETAVV